MNTFHEPPVCIKEYPVYVDRQFVSDMPNVIFCPDIRLIKTDSGQFQPFTEKIFLDQIVQAIVNSGANPYILTFEDFPYIPYLLEQADAILFYPGSDMPS